MFIKIIYTNNFKNSNIICNNNLKHLLYPPVMTGVVLTKLKSWLFNTLSPKEQSINTYHNM